MKKISQLVLVIISVCFLVTVTTNTLAYGTDYNEDYVKYVETTRSEYIIGGALLEVQKLNTADVGTANKEWWNSTLQYVEPLPGNNDYEIVSWSKGAVGEQAYKAYTVIDLARDYELKHPGYIVAAAVNGDFFNIGGDGSPSNYHVQEGDVYRHTGSSSAVAVGFSGGVTATFGKPTFTTTPNVHLLDEKGASVEIIPTVVYNGTMSKTGVSLFVKNSQGVDATGMYVYQITNDIFRVPGGNISSTKDIFVKGKITATFHDISELPVGSTYSYVTSPTELNLKVGDTVKCQYDMTGAFANVTNVIAGNYHLLVNGVSQSPTDNTKHPRTMIGLKADGTPILAVVDGRGEDSKYLTGASYFIQAEMLKALGCVQGFNLDGGGSSTLVIRDGKGNFEIINTPSDGTPRSDGNAVLLVTRDNRIRLGNITDTSIEVKQLGQVENGTISDLKVRYGSQTVDLEVGGSATLTGLTRGTTYDVVVSYNITANGTTTPCEVNLRATTASARFPNIDSFRISKATEDSFTVSYRITKRELAITKVEILFYDGRYEISADDRSYTVSDVIVTEGDVVELLISLDGGYELRETTVIESVQSSNNGGGGEGGGCNFGVGIAGAGLAALGALLLARRKD